MNMRGADTSGTTGGAVRPARGAAVVHRNMLTVPELAPHQPGRDPRHPTGTLIHPPGRHLRFFRDNTQTFRQPCRDHRRRLRHLRARCGAGCGRGRRDGIAVGAGEGAAVNAEPARARRRRDRNRQDQDAPGDGRAAVGCGRARVPRRRQGRPVGHRRTRPALGAHHAPRCRDRNRVGASRVPRAVPQPGGRRQRRARRSGSPSPRSARSCWPRC